MKKLFDLHETSEISTAAPLDDNSQKNPAQALWEEGFKLEIAGELEQARERYLESVETDPSYQTAYVHLAYVYMKQGKLDRAAQSLKMAEEINSENEHLFVACGHYCLYEKNPKKAIENYKKALELNERSAGARLGLGNAFLQGGQLMEALEQYEEVLKLEPSRAEEIFLRRGEVFSRANLFRDAIREFEEALKNNPSNPDARTHLASCYEYLGEKKLASSHYRFLLKLIADPARLQAIRERLKQLEGE